MAVEAADGPAFMELPGVNFCREGPPDAGCLVTAVWGLVELIGCLVGCLNEERAG